MTDRDECLYVGDAQTPEELLSQPTPKQREEREEDIAFLLQRASEAEAQARAYETTEEGTRHILRAPAWRETAETYKRVAARLRTHSPEEPVGWQPIETVPNDGRMVLGLFGPDWIEGFYSMPDGTWHWHDGDSREEPPTHWMPLPAPHLDPEDTP